jgi:hypothetical protein
MTETDRPEIGTTVDPAMSPALRQRWVDGMHSPDDEIRDFNHLVRDFLADQDG